MVLIMQSSKGFLNMVSSRVCVFCFFKQYPDIPRTNKPTKLVFRVTRGPTDSWGLYYQRTLITTSFLFYAWRMGLNHVLQVRLRVVNLNSDVFKIWLSGGSSLLPGWGEDPGCFLCIDLIVWGHHNKGGVNRVWGCLLSPIEAPCTQSVFQGSCLHPRSLRKHKATTHY